MFQLDTNIEPWHLVEGVSAITPDRLKNLVHAVERTRGVPGDMAELGVYKGGGKEMRIETTSTGHKVLYLTRTDIWHLKHGREIADPALIIMMECDCGRCNLCLKMAKKGKPKCVAQPNPGT